jgi:hypothetical protein
MRPALWLMDRFGVSEALVGDLLEGQYRHQSRFRFWRQTIVAILNATRHDVLGHRALALRAVLVGWTLHWIIAQCRRPGMQLMAGWAWKVDLWLTRSLGVYIPVYFLIKKASARSSSAGPCRASIGPTACRWCWCTSPPCSCLTWAVFSIYFTGVFPSSASWASPSTQYFRS